MTTPTPSHAVEVRERGAAVLRHPLLNKGTAFTATEREQLGLTGLLPATVTTMDEQAARAYASIARKTDPLERYIGMVALQDRNEHLYYRVLGDHLEELLPIVYTPTVGEACAQFSHIFRRGRGLWITPDHRGRMVEVLRNGARDARLIVVTDNERILGLGDLGAGGMGIPIGKLAIYVAAAGVHPAQTLPVSLDVGTDNEALRSDPMYLGWRAPRLRGPAYEALLDEFAAAVRTAFPNAVLQWEDFKKGTAFRLLERHRSALPSFNDDIQGTAAVVLASVLASERLTGRPLTGERIVILGAGAAGIGIAHLLRAALLRQRVSLDEAVASIAILDSRGLLVNDEEIDDTHKRPFAWPAPLAIRHGLGRDRRQLLDVVRALKPTVLVGTSGEPGTFPEDVLREMARHVDVPVVLPLSNPTANCEAVPEDILRWTEGRALVATGSPFDPVAVGTRRVRIGQANNAFVFPAIGLAALVSRASVITDGMFRVAAEALAAQVTATDLAEGSLFPPVSDLRRVTRQVARAVVREARDAGVGLAFEDGAIADAVDRAIWTPAYPQLIPVGDLVGA
jgi:malate dehydrogenase (oxaloacetate-decarboxylating)